MRSTPAGRRAWVRVGLVSMVVGLLMASFASPAQAAKAERNPVDFAFSALAAKWWEWGLEQPAATNPLSDPDGQFCGNEQHGPVWFLAGTGGTLVSPVTRSCTIPRGKALFFPVVNAFSGWVEGDPPEARSAAAQRALLEPYGVKQATGLSVTVDGKRILGVVRYEESKVFRVVLPDGSLFQEFYPGGTVVYPTVDAGYYALLAPLPPGNHTLKFTGQLPTVPNPFVVDVTYNLTVSRR